jgi:ABC-type uncharacterized transport system involved in gliding motility auxiliary subunit
VPFEFIFTEKQIEESIDNPEKLISQHNPGREQYTLIALVHGSFSSFFADKEVPEPAKDPEEEGKPPEGAKEEPARPKPETVKKTNQPNRIVVVADSDCISDEFLSWAPNAQFFANLVDWLATGEDLARIRAKAGRSRPLTVNENARVWYQIMMIGLMPLIVVVVGVGRHIVRRGAGDQQ